ncbi:galactokinase [Rhizoctonia solani]|uniref:Galactokinase n=1 Tax=Rhizoctonia solani TaxID=456999 RepID=A0A8H7H650_9AGAM|nr:galactokinase [Rhizoctonia solani]
MERQVIAYYCSGHGYGHATRVNFRFAAFTSHLLELGSRFEVHIVSSAPAHIFSDCLKASEHCHYRYAEIDPVVAQPLAYRVDRDKSVRVLERFLSQRDAKIAQELEWLGKIGACCVLSDSAFLACAAANAASLPCALVTNFTFDSVYSYLGTQFIDESPSSQSTPHQEHAAAVSELPPDVPIPESILAPLVDQIVKDYRCADLLLRLPGAIPIPSFSPNHPLPAPNWVDLETCRFKPEVTNTLLQQAETLPLYPSIPFPTGKSKPVSRQIRQAPLLVRHPTPDTDRTQLLDYIGVPRSFHGHKVLIVSFGGQVIKRPTGTRTPSRTPSPNYSPPGSTINLQNPTPPSRPRHHRHTSSVASVASLTASNVVNDPERLHAALASPARIATPSHIYVPGAPPASNPSSPMLSTVRSNSTGPVFASFFTPPTPGTEFSGPPAPGAFVEVKPHKDIYLTVPHSLPTPDDSAESSPIDDDLDIPRLIPEGWIAIVCGVSKNWGEEDLPERFFVAPKDVYMPDVTAMGDVLLGKLGYGTCAECVDSCTPFVYVPRALFVEEHGLRMLMETAGTGVELPRERYEAGDWASAIEEAWALGAEKKIARRLLGARGDARRRRQGEEMAREFEAWLSLWTQPRH